MYKIVYCEAYRPRALCPLGPAATVVQCCLGGIQGIAKGDGLLGAVASLTQADVGSCGRLCMGRPTGMDGRLPKGRETCLTYVALWTTGALLLSGGVRDCPNGTNLTGRTATMRHVETSTAQLTRELGLCYISSCGV